MYAFPFNILTLYSELRTVPTNREVVYYYAGKEDLSKLRAIEIRKEK